jgi:mannosyltransferase
LEVSVSALKLSRRARWVTACLLAGFFLRAEGLGRESLWHDEAHSALMSRLSASEIVRQTALQDFNPPLYYLLLHYWIAAAGDDDEATLRAISAGAGMLGVLATFIAARQLGGDIVGVWALALASTSVFLIQHSREARMYSLLYAGSTWSTFALLRLRSGTWGSQVLWIVSTVATLLAHSVGVFVVAAQQTMWLLMRRIAPESMPGLRTWLALNGVALVLVAPWAWVVASQYNRLNHVFWIPPTYLSAPLDVLIQLAGSRPLFVMFFVAAAAGAIALLRGRIHASAAHGWPRRGVLMFLLLWGGGSLLFPWLVSIVDVPIFIPRVAIATLAPLFILTAFGLSAIRPRWLGETLGVLLVAGATVSAWSMTHRMTKEDWRSVTRAIETAAGPDDLLLFHEASRRAGFDYYATRGLTHIAGFPRRRMPAGESVKRDELAELDRLVAPYSRVWLILCNSRDPERLIEATLGRRLRLTTERRFFNVTVLLFERATNDEVSCGRDGGW